MRLFTSLSLLMALFVTACAGSPPDIARAPLPAEFLPGVPSFNISSSDISDGQALRMKFVHDSASGQNISPELSWSGAPEGTKSYAITCFDPDAPTGSGFWHWMVLDLPTTTLGLPEGAGADGDGQLPGNAFQIRNDFGAHAYGGAAPPPGDRAHRYVFTVHALDTESVGLPKGASAAFGGFMITQHTLARATIIPEYAR